MGADEPLRTRVFARASLERGETIAGPAIVEQSDTTIVVYPGQHAQLDGMNNLIVTGISEAYTS